MTNKKAQVEEVSPNELFFDQIKSLINKNCLAASPEEAVVGIEVENEELKGIGWPQNINGWTNHSENSLRFNGFEYVMHPPQRLDVAESLVKNLFESCRKFYKEKGLSEPPWSNSIRTSIHVHFDVGQLTWLQLYNFATLYWLCEPIISHFAGQHRRGNLFCLRIKDSTYTKFQIQNELSQEWPMSSTLYNEEYRYASVNFNSIKKFGTLEFRIMRGVSDEKDILIWMQILNTIRLKAIKFKTPLDLLHYYMEETSATSFVQSVLGSNLWSIIKPYIPEGVSVKEEIQDAYLTVHGILTARKDWKLIKISERIKKHISNKINNEANLGPIMWANPVQVAISPGFADVYYVPNPDQDALVSDDNLEVQPHVEIDV